MSSKDPSAAAAAPAAATNTSASAPSGTTTTKDANTAALLLAAAAENKDPLRVDETLTRIEHHHGVVGVLIINHDGVVIRSSLDNVQTIQYATLMSQLAAMARGVVRDLDPENDMRIFRLRTKKHEIMVSQEPRRTVSA